MTTSRTGEVRTIRRPNVSNHVVDILGWPTDTISIDFADSDGGDGNAAMAHTTLIFFPGNPGCCAWYQPLLLDLVTALGPCFRARMVSYAGHAPYHPQHSNAELLQATKDASLVWTVDGQIRHKEAFVDEYCCTSLDQQQQQQQQQQFIFLSHSIGSHMVERLLMQRTDILQRTACVIHLMPFIRMSSPYGFDQVKLDFCAANPQLLIGIARAGMKYLFQNLMSLESINALLEHQNVFEDSDGRDLAAHLLQQPHYGRNFFELGTEEIRDVPYKMDATAHRQISRHCPLVMLYCAKDQWAPYEHVAEIQDYASKNPQKHFVSIHYFPDHRHDFVSVDAMIPPIARCCLQTIQQCLGQQKGASDGFRSRL